MRCKCIILAILFSWVSASAALAGDIDSPGTQPADGSGMHTLQELYDYLLNGATPTISGIFQEPAEGPASTGKTTKEIYDAVKALFDAADATADQVLDSATFFSTDPANWGPRAGTLSAQTPSSATASQPEGYYAAFNLSAVDADLVAGNIKNGVEMFGVTGTVIESSGDAAAGDVLTGKTFSNATAAGVAGAMPNNGAVNISPGSSDQTIAAGYHNGSGIVAGDGDLVAANIKSGMQLFGVTGTVIESAGDAAAGDVLAGKTFSNNTAAGVSGTMPNNGTVNITPGTTDQTIAAGYHDGSGTVAGDADLGAANIKSGMDIFGVIGAYPLAGVEKTGQTTSYATGDDGDLEKGAAFPIPRFTDNGDGTVTDNLTDLVWLQDAYCTETVGGINNGSGVLTWAEALTWSNSLANGSCGLTDGSTAGEWRLPNIKELQSLLHFGYSDPPVSNAAGTGQWEAGDPFSGIPEEFNWYWSSTTVADSMSDAWCISMGNGARDTYAKINFLSVWPVRDGNNP